MMVILVTGAEWDWRAATRAWPTSWWETICFSWGEMTAFFRWAPAMTVSTLSSKSAWVTEYLPSLIRQWGKTSIRAYFGGCTAELERFCELFGEDLKELLDVPFTVATPDSSTPYRQMYVAN